MAKSNAVLSPNLGLYLGLPLLSVPKGGLADGYNFRISEGKLSNLNLGWTRFSTFTLNGPVLLVANFLPVSQGLPSQLILGTRYDLYLYNPNTDKVSFLTPRYNTGNVQVTGANVVGTGTNFLDAAAHIRAGDEFFAGSSAQTDPAAAWTTIDHVVDATHLVLTGPSNSGDTGAGAIYTIRRKFSGGDSTVWSTETYVRDPIGVDTWWATNGVDNIVRWQAANTQVDDEFSGLVMGFKAKQLRVFSNMMIFGNVTVAGTIKGTDIINSDVGNPANVATGLFSEFKVHSGSDEILSLGQLGDNLIIYSKFHVVQASFQGAPLIFAFRSMGTHNGPVGGRAVADFGNYHEFLGPDSQYIFDGVNITEVSAHVWRELLRTQDPLRIGNSYTLFDVENGEVHWVLPLTSDPNSGVITSPAATSHTEHYLEQIPANTPRPYSRRSWPFTAAGFYTKQSVLTWDQLGAWNTLNFRWNDQFFFKAFPFALVGDVNGKVYSLNANQNAEAVALPSFVKFGRKPTMDGQRKGLVGRVYPWVTQFITPMNVTVHLADFAAGVPTINDAKAYDQSLPEGQTFTDHYRRGRFVDLEFGSLGPSQPWELHGYDIDVKPGGGR